MLALNISCPVCKDIFKSSDAIYSTSCGHIFHFFCMNQWKSKSSSCPQCRSYNPTTHSIFFNFEDTREYEKIVNDLKQQLESSNDNVKKILLETDKKDKRIDEIKRLYNISEQWRAELEDKIKKLNHEHEEQKMKLSKELELKLNEICSLKTQIERVGIENGIQELLENINKSNEELKLTVDRLITENSTLKEKFGESEMSNMILNHKLEMQEQRLKHVTIELEKQIAESINHNSQPTEKLNQMPAKTHKRRNRRKNPTENNSNTVADLNASISSLKQPKEFSNPNDSKVIIKDYPHYQLIYPLEKTVILLASKMSITLTPDDITAVSLIHSNNFNNILKVSLLVEFKTVDGKIKFITNKHRLKLRAATHMILIKEYIDQNIHPIFMYANRNLRANGYEYICCKNNKVFAKKKLHDVDEILIQNKNDVDILLLHQNNDVVNFRNSTTNILSN